MHFFLIFRKIYSNYLFAVNSSIAVTKVYIMYYIVYAFRVQIL